MGSITPRVPRRRHAARRISACLTLAAMAGMTYQASGTAYTWTGTGTDSLWSDTGNWNPATGYPSFNGGTADTATFGGTVTTNNLPNLDGNYTLGQLIFSAASGGWTINNTSGSTLTLNGVSGIGINALSQTSGTTTLNANFALSADQTFEVGAGGTMVFNGTILGGVGGSTDQTPTLTLTGGGTFDILSDSVDGISTPGLGNIVVNAGTLDVSGAGIVNTAALTINSGGTVIADDSTKATPYRFAFPGTPFTTNLNGGTFELVGNNITAVNESLGDTIVGTGLSTITVSPAGNTPTLILNTLKRDIGSGLLFVNGNGLGTAGSSDGVFSNGQINVANGFGGTGPGLVGGKQVGALDDPSTQNAMILPYVLGEVPVASSAVGSQTGVPDTFVAYTSAGTLRPLNPVDEYSHVINSTIDGNNVYITQATAASTATINSLVINGGDVTVGNSQAITDTSGGLLFVSSNSILGQNATFSFGPTEGVVTVNPGITGTLQPLLSGTTPITLDGSGQLNLTGSSSGYAGTIRINTGAALQFGNGTSGNDGNLGSSATVIMNGSSGSGVTNLMFDDVASTVNVPFTISAQGALNFISWNNTGTTNVTGPIDVTSNAINSFFIFNGGPVNFATNITSETLNSQYFYDRTSSPITLSGAANNIAYSAKFYLQAINGANAYTGESFTIPAGASFSTALTSTARTVYITNENNNINTGAPQFANQLPPPATFNLNGSMTTYIVYMGGYSVGGTSSIGQTTMNVTGTAASPATLNADLYTSFIAVAMPNTVSSSVYVGPYATVTSTPTSGFGFKLALGGYSYLNIVGPNATVTDGTPTQAGTNEMWLGSGGDAFMEIGGSSTGTATVNVSDGAGAANNKFTVGNNGLVLADSSAASNVVDLNVYHNGVLNWNPGIVNDNNFILGMTAGQQAVVNVIGGQINNTGKNSPIELGAVAGVNALLNINSDASGNVGQVVTSYLTANASNSSAFVNFNGGELQYSNAGGTGTQGTFISGKIAGGAYIYQNGAIIGSNGQSITIPVALKAPAGNGISGITITGGGQGYTAPPLVQITGGGGKDASAYATWDPATGAVTGIVVTSPGFGYTSTPTITFIDGGAPGAAGASYPFAPAAATASIAPNSLSGGLTKVDTGTLILSQSNTYAGPTLVNAGTLQFTGASNATNAVTVLTQPTANAATLYVSNAGNNNNLASAATLLIGDVAAGSGTTAGKFTIATTAAGGFVLNSTAVSPTAGQTLGGFGTVNGTSAFGLTVGNQTVIAPGTGSGTAVKSAAATGGGPADMSPGTPTATFNTIKGNATGTATGALTLTSGNAAAPMTTTFASGGTYYWKLNLATGGGGATTTPGTLTPANANISGAAWDALIVDSLSVTSTTTSPFTIQAVPFGTVGQVNLGGSSSYSWVIAHAGDASIAANLLAGLALNASALPTPAQGYGYYLSTLPDPTSGTDLVVNYVPTPEPSALMLLAPAAGAMFLRRRRKARTAEAAA